MGSCAKLTGRNRCKLLQVLHGIDQSHGLEQSGICIYMRGHLDNPITMSCTQCRICRGTSSSLWGFDCVRPEASAYELLAAFVVQQF